MGVTFSDIIIYPLPGTVKYWHDSVKEFMQKIRMPHIFSCYNLLVTEEIHLQNLIGKPYIFFSLVLKLMVKEE